MAYSSANIRPILIGDKANARPIFAGMQPTDASNNSRGNFERCPFRGRRDSNLRAKISFFPFSSLRACTTKREKERETSSVEARIIGVFLTECESKTNNHGTEIN